MNRRTLVLLLLALAAPAEAHPLPSLRHDRTVSIRLAPKAVTVKYALEVSPLTMFLDGKDLFSPAEIAALRGDRDYAALYAKKLGPLLADNLRATLDDKPLTFRLEKQDLELSDHVRCRYTFAADWAPPPGKRVAFAFEDFNFPDKAGIENLTVDQAGLGAGLILHDLEEPPLGLRTRPTVDLKPGEADLLRKASALLEVKASPAAQPLEAEPPRPPEPTAAPPSERPSLASNLFDRGLAALFEPGYGLGILLLAAFLFGAAHAFTPGHGKTLVAAYLVGERGTVGHAIFLGLTTTLAHTGSVIAIAVVLRLAYGNNVPGATQGILQFLGGLLVAGVGLWLLMRRIVGKADHVHLFGDHHHHDHDHSHGGHHHHHGPPPVAAPSAASWTRLLLMGLGGGLIPCWDAVLLLIAAIAMDKLSLALPLLLAFSLGLGFVLVALGVSVVHAHRAGTARFQESRWFRHLPTVSATLLVLIGFWLCQEGIRLANRG